jgi:hypothetical protein
MRDRDRSVLAWVAAGLCLLVGAIALYLALTVPSSEHPQASRILFAGWSLVFGPVGLLILTKRSGNRIGWVALGLAFSAAAVSITSDLSRAYGGGGSGPGLGFELLSNISWLIWISLIAWFLVLFPNGVLPSRRWRPLGWALAAWPPLLLITAVLAPQTFSGGDPVPNPFGGIGGGVGDFLNVAVIFLNVLMFPLLLGALLAAMLRFRRSRGAERQQLKWLAYWAVLFAVAVVFSVVAPNAATNLVTNLALSALPITVAIAILRYRLYDIDLLINRTLVYGMTSATIAITFWAGIVVLQALLRPLTAGSQLAIAASTLLSFALFQPVRLRIQDAVDRRFNRSRYNAARALDAFAVRMRDEVDLDALRAHLLGVVNRTVAPSQASLWLRSDHPEKELATPRL